MSTFKFSKYNSRRSDVLGSNGSIATSHPLAANAGLDILKKGGNLIFIRHAYAPGGGDPVNFNINDCSTQRNLSNSGTI